MSIVAQGQITLVDIGDLGELSVVPQSNLPTMIVYDPQNESYTPNWSTSNLILTPIIYYGSLSISPTAVSSLKWYRQLGTAARTEITASTTGHSITNGVLTVNTNMALANDLISYIIEITYTEPNTSTSLHAIGQISFAKVKNGTDGINGFDAESLTITGANAFLYNENGVCQNPSITLNAAVQHTTLDKWQYKNSSDVWTNISGASSSNLIIQHTASYFINDVAYIRAVATNSNVYDEHSIVKLRDGAPGDAVDSVILSNESQMVPCDADNVPVTDAFTNCNTVITIYEGNEDHTSDWSFNVDTTHGVTGIWGGATGSGTVPPYTFQASNMGENTVTGYVVFTCTKTGHATLTKTYSLVKVRAGADGQPGQSGDSPTIYTLDVDTLVINKDVNNANTYTPSVIHLNGYSQTGNDAKVPYTTGWLKLYSEGSAAPISYAKASTLSYTITGELTKLTAQLCAASNSSTIYDSQTILVVSDGINGSNGTDGLNFILGNYQDVIPCTNEGLTISNSTITIPFTVYQGTVRHACTIANPSSSLPSGMVVNSIIDGTSSNNGTLTITVQSGKNLGGVDTGTISLTIRDTTNNKTATQVYTWTKNKQAKNGDSGYNSATIYRYIRSSSTPSKPSGTFRYTFATGGVAYVGSGVNPLSGWSENIPASNINHDPCYVIMASVRSTAATVDFEWSNPIKIIEDGADGADGDKFTVDVNTETIYRFYNVERIASVSYNSYDFSLRNSINQILETNTYNIVISMLPIADTGAQDPTIKETLLKDGCTNIITELTNKAQFPYLVYNSVTNEYDKYYGGVEKLLTQDANVYSFHVDRLMDMIQTDSSSFAEINAFLEILREFNVTFLVTFTASNNSNQIYTKQLLHLDTAVNIDLAAFANSAVQVNDAITQAGFIFSSEGLTINGGNLVITNKFQDTVFDFNKENGKLTVRGTIEATSGYFGGILTAATGEFSGKVSIGTNSTIAGFKVNDEDQLVSTEGSAAIILDGSNGHITANSITLGEDATIGTFIKLGDAYLYNPARQDHKLLETGEVGTDHYILIKDNGQAIFGNIMVNGERGSLSGTNWYINSDEASFSNIYVSGKIRTAVFEVGHVSAVSGAMVFRPAAKIININPNNRSQITVDDITDLDVNDLITIDGFRTTISNIAETTLTLRAALPESIEVGQNIVNLGDGKKDNTIIGVNSMSTAIGDFSPQAISIIELDYDVVNDVPTTPVPIPRILLGNLNGTQSIIGFDNAEGYGLYADNVYLNGSLTTRYTNNNTIGYAGINTISRVNFNKTTGDISPIIFWAGSTGISADAIRDSLYQVSANGTLYAQNAIITGSIIANSELRGPRLYGSGDSPALQIFDTKGGITFYNLDNGIEYASFTIDNLGLVNHYYVNGVQQNNRFVSIDTDSNNAVFIGIGNFISATIGNITISTNKITTGNLILDTSKYYFGSDLEVEYRKVSGGYDLYIT